MNTDAPAAGAAAAAAAAAAPALMSGRTCRAYKFYRGYNLCYKLTTLFISSTTLLINAQVIIKDRSPLCRLSSSCGLNISHHALTCYLLKLPLLIYMLLTST